MNNPTKQQPERTIVSTEKAPAAVGPYSQAVRTGGLIFTSGQIPLDPGTGALVDGDIRTQTRRVFDNLKAVLAAAGSSLDHVVKFTCFITSMSDFPAVNEIFKEYLAAVETDSGYPARSCVEVGALPKGASVEIEAVAVENPRLT
ncbi:MAG TPA: RidA family protein [Spirochaetia bacterium]|nr:RidA family protein [Spirochaetia bacterium]